MKIIDKEYSKRKILFLSLPALLIVAIIVLFVFLNKKDEEKLENISQAEQSSESEEVNSLVGAEDNTTAEVQEFSDE